MRSFNEKIKNLEKEYNVEYPILENATYKSLVNYGTDLSTPIQRWYRYKEGYSIKLIEKLLTEYNLNQGITVLDPFSGSGSTLLQAKINKMKSIGFEVNPFSFYLSKIKTQNYSYGDLKEFKKTSEILLKTKTTKTSLKKPKLSTIDKLFHENILEYLLSIKQEIKKINNTKVRNLFSLAWLSILEDASNYRKAGNGLKKRIIKQVNERNIEFTKKILKKRINEIELDLPYAINLSGINEPKIYLESSKKLNKYIKGESINAIFFSPPYANCFDYTEIYKVELWMGEFVKDYHDFKPLRNSAVRSHLNCYKISDSSNKNYLVELSLLIKSLESIQLWDKRIPTMVQNYFIDMFEIIIQLFNSLKRGGVCGIIVSNSSYGGIIIPTDLLIAKYSKKIGFKVKKIEVARFIITSSQQYNKTKKYKKFLRESIIHLQK